MARSIKTDIKVWNFVDEMLVRRGLLKESELIKLEFKDVRVDTGATCLVLPEEVVKQLKLPIDGKTWVKYADERREEKSVASGVRVEVLNRVGTFDAIVERCKTPLVGMVVLEQLDLWPDTQEGKLITNPESPDMPLFDLL